MANGALLTAAGLAGQGLVFARSIVLARLISPSDMGIAVLLQTVVAFFELASDLSTGTYLIQSEQGDQEVMQGTATTVTVLRGVGNGLLIVIFAYPVAWMFGLAAIWPAFAAMSLVPLMRGVMHLDAYRLQRHHRFVPQIAYEFGGQLAGAVVSMAVAVYIRDYRAMLYGLLVQSVVGTLVTHAFAERKYGLGFDREKWRQILHFGWPLTLNGLIMFGLFQGDRFIIGAEKFFPAYTKDDLALYSIAFSLTLMPSLIVSKIAMQLLLPRMAGFQSNPAAFTRQSTLAMDALAITGGLQAILFVITGSTLMPAIFGAKYSHAGAILAWLAAMQAVRLLRFGTTLTALAKGDSRNSLNCNLFRLSGMVAAVGVAVAGWPMVYIAICGLFGEIVAVGASVVGLVRRHRMPWVNPVRSALLVLVALIMAGLSVFISSAWSRLLIQVGLAAIVAALYTFAVFALSPGVRNGLRSLAAGLQSHLSREPVHSR